MSSTPNQIWESISNHTATLAEQAGKAIVAVDAGHRVAASGVHWKPGIIVTASHLVRRAAEVDVILPDDSRVKGTVAGRDSTTDLAAVRIESDATLPILPFGSGAKVGELVLAVARSGRGELSASAGIVARIGGPWRTWRGGQVDRLLRPDVRLYPGQSGSALVNGRGELLGVNSSVLARESVITLPTETVDHVLKELLGRGHIAQPYLGIAMQGVPLPQEWRASAGSDQEHGLLVMHVAPDGPAQQAGISLGDLITSVDAQPVQGFRELYHLLGQKRTGEAVKLRVLRAGNSINAEVILGDRPRR
ncbi:MAG TPA: S1C family serine protease [Terriglobales bacterium]|nr:S1C family serine protease [Terriglobales bacterium]